eukprot:Pgem_evm1s9075
MKDIREYNKTNYHFFWQTASCFSQFHPSKFESEGVQFICCEQAMMYNKAILFQDFTTASAILDETDPPRIKNLGRQVNGFKDKVWNEHKEE